MVSVHQAVQCFRPGGKDTIYCSVAAPLGARVTRQEAGGRGIHVFKYNCQNVNFAKSTNLQFVQKKYPTVKVY